ncbi:ead/Ea22-like family protein [Enterobacter hormaechei]|nr:ead/Ea22-like family protein [Enterobacter hormaechei]WRS84092.1 ead/Ea22-like family protein [Enterobacter hormaechei]
MSNIDKRALREAAEKHGDDDILALLDELEAAEKRITELERNEIREEGNQFLVVRHPGKLPVVKHCAGELEGFLRQLLKHDPMATIDIVTHRYYGVGGQWVQDADEYLQMMAAAAGKGE